MQGKRPSLIVFGDDWGRHPSSAQHLVSRLLDDFDVIWINTIGTRPVRLDRVTLVRGWEKLRHWSSSEGSRRAERAPRVVNPLMWPGFGGNSSRKLNRWLLARTLRRELVECEFFTVLTTVPLVADLVGHFPGARWIYYCVDDFSSWPGLDGDTLAEMESSLVQTVDEVIAAGENLATRIRALGREPRILSHGVDLEHWSVQSVAGLPDAFASLQRPVVLFWGLVDQRIDIAWLERLSELMDSGTIGLVGPHQAPDVRLQTIPRVELLGPLDYDQLPAAAAVADVLIMPYRDMAVTRAMQPLKLKEYIATGKPVVVRQLPGTDEWSDCVSEADSADDFADAVLRSVALGVPDSQRGARQRLDQESWAAKASLLRNWIAAMPPA